MTDGGSEGEVMQEYYSRKDVGSYLKYCSALKDRVKRDATRLE
jgi:hypothetical protein